MGQLEGQAEWDGRQAFMMRLHEALMKAHRSNFNNDYFGWYKALIVLKLELSPHVRTEEEKDSVKDAFVNLTPGLLNSNSNQQKFLVCVNAQKSLHQIMRNRKFDVPMGEHKIAVFDE